MFFKFRDWELWSEGGVVESQRTITGGSEEMRGMCFGVRDIVKGVLGRVAIDRRLALLPVPADSVVVHFQGHNPMGCQFQYIEPPVPNQPVIRCRCDSDPIVKEWRIFDGIALKALGSEF